MIFAAAACAGAWLAAGDEGTPAVTYVQLAPERGCSGDAVLADVDGDGRADLVVAVGACPDDEGAPSPRRLQVHLRREGTPAFRARPDRELALVRDVVAWAVADVDPAPGAEIMLLSASRAVAATWAEGAAEPGYASLFETRFLWQPADAKGAPAWQQGVRDVDGDGLDDLVLPEPDGYRVALQRRGSEGRSFQLSVLRPPPAPLAEEERGAARFEARRSELSPSFVPDSSSLEPLIEVHERIGVPRLLDWDGDGDLDLAALSGRRLVVWLQEHGALSGPPALERPLPGRRARLLDPSYSVQLCDLDGDARADLVLVSGRTDGDDVTSTIEVFLQAGGAGYQRSADDRLRIQGFVDVPRLDDVDGDGRPDLTLGSLRPDLIGALASRGGGGIEAQLNLFRNRFEPGGGRFQRPVALVEKLHLAGDVADRGWYVIARFARDVDGDGLRDLFLRVAADRVEVRRTETRGRGLSVGERVWSMDVQKDAPVDLVETGGATVLLLREPQQIVHVEFR